MHRLESENFSDDHISVVFPNTGALDVPGLGPFIASGPIIADLCGAVGDGGGIASGLAALGVSEAEAGRCQQEIEKGNFLLSVHAADLEQIDRAKVIFARMGAQLICSPGPAAQAMPG
jgi:hypothetical protein